MTPEPFKNYKNDEAAYTLIDRYLKSLSEANLNELIFHLKHQIAVSSIGGGPVQKAITTIRAMIEDKGGDPDELLHQLQEMPEGSSESLDEFLQYLCQQTNE